MNRQWLLAWTVLLGASAVSPLALNAEPVRTAVPGTINYVEGQVFIEGHALTEKQEGNTRLQPNQRLTTGQGKVEMLLSPGVFARVGANSEIKMVSTGLVDPTTEIVRGEAMVEVDQKLKDARIDVLEHGATASILKAGLYEFDGDQSLVKVVDGKARISENGQEKEIGKGKEITINGEPLKAVSFDRKAEDDLYRWSSVRSGYLAEANGSTAQNVYLGYGPDWGMGWYWNPYFASWSWLPGDGLFYSPFGYPFYSPAYVIRAPYRFGIRPGFQTGFRGGFAGRGFINRGRGFTGRSSFSSAPHPGGRGFSGAPHGGFSGGHGGGRR